VNSPKPLPNLRRATISVQVYEHLRQQIVDGSLAPCQPIAENGLAAALKVSRTPVREALGKLEKEGLVQIIPQYGTFVAPIQTEQVYGNQFIREALECAAIPDAARRCTDAGARQLHALLEAQRSAPDDQSFFRADEEMHALLMAISGQQTAWRVVETAKLHLDRVRHLAVRDTSKRLSIVAEHTAIVTCVIDGNADGAVAALRAHLRGVFTSTEPAMARYPHYFLNESAEVRPARHVTKSITMET
jgi:DNA-binding GntR family transcriptional regulator